MTATTLADYRAALRARHDELCADRDHHDHESAKISAAIHELNQAILMLPAEHAAALPVETARTETKPPAERRPRTTLGDKIMAWVAERPIPDSSFQMGVMANAFQFIKPGKIEAALNRLVAEGKLVRDGAGYRKPIITMPPREPPAADPGMPPVPAFLKRGEAPADGAGA